MHKVGVVWMRTDVRLSDHGALDQAIASDLPLVLFYILPGDCLVSNSQSQRKKNYIQYHIQQLNKKLKPLNAQILCSEKNLQLAWHELMSRFDVARVFYLMDFDPWAIQQIQLMEPIWKKNNIQSEAVEADLIFQPDEILKSDGKPYKKFTAYKNACYRAASKKHWPQYTRPLKNLYQFDELPADHDAIPEPPFSSNLNEQTLQHYSAHRNIPSLNGTSRISADLAFGIRSLRTTFLNHQQHSIFADELLWRNFFIQIMYHFPHAAAQSFKPAYDAIAWRNNQQEFDAWCQGKTGFPMVDAGMRQLRATGWMHNRVRMITASFICKQLLIDWRWGMDYFADYLIDHQFAVNNGNWQWCAGTGCDAAPYFRVFNPETQRKKFDPKQLYIQQWIPEWGSADYPAPIVDLKLARQRALQTYRTALNG